VTRRLRNASDRVVLGAASGITRRRLFRTSGRAALVASMSAAFLDKVFIDPSYAVTCFGFDCGTECKTNSLCGPSPGCGSNHCQGNGQCLDELTFGSRHRFYEGGTCEQNLQNKINCWCSCSSNGTLRRCCDCCQRNSTGVASYCTSCPNGETWYRCICSTILCQGCC
jgi:hypothetical protein